MRAMLRMKASIVTLALLVAGFAGGKAHAEMVTGLNAVVHDSVVTYQEVELFAAPAIETARRQYGDDRQAFMTKVNSLLADSLEQLIERQLILNDFKVSGYNLPDTIIEESVKERIRERYGDRKTLTKTLQAQGMTYEKFRQQMRDQIIVEALRAKNISSEIIISPHKIEEFYEAHKQEYQVEDQVKLRMIVLNKADTNDTHAVKLGEEIVGKLKDGASFTEMATVYSQGSQRGDAGDWGWGTRTSLRKELADVAFKLQPGEISDVVETAGACFIMLVEETKPAHTRPLSEMRAEIEKTLLVAERARLSNQYVEKLKKKTFVRYF